MKDTELSIIIPVYNGQDYIVRCMDSIMRQQGADQYEIIVVDDGSADDTPKILDAAANVYKNIRVIHQKNAGVSVARNNGIVASHGKYVTFVDIDDMVGLKDKAFDEYFFGNDPRCFRYAGELIINNTHDFPDTLSDKHFDDGYFVNMLHVAYKTNADVILGGKIDINRDEWYMRQYNHKSENIYSSAPNDKGRALEEANGRESANFALYKREMLNMHNLRFMVNMNLDEDILFCMLAVLRANTVATVPDVTYFYDRHVGTLSNMSDLEKYQKQAEIATDLRFSVLLTELAKIPQYKNVFSYWMHEYSQKPCQNRKPDCKYDEDCTHCPIAVKIMEECNRNINVFCNQTEIQK